MKNVFFFHLLTFVTRYFRGTCRKLRNVLPDKSFVVRWICEEGDILKCRCSERNFSSMQIFRSESAFVCERCFLEVPEHFLFARHVFWKRTQFCLCFSSFGGIGNFTTDCHVCKNLSDSFCVFRSDHFDEELEQHCCCVLWWVIYRKHGSLEVVREFVQVLKANFTFSVAWRLVNLCLEELGPCDILDYLHEQADILKPRKIGPVKYRRAPPQKRRRKRDEDEDWIDYD